jgi:2',3'-cyclic-nucleotide 2'-phosphodiesterase (5'-nucleotidase family)
VSNAIDTRTNKPIGGAKPYLVESIGPLKVGFIGLVLTTTEIGRGKLGHTRLVDPIAAAGRYLPALQREGARVIVAITHLTFDDDRRLVRRYPQIDLVIGGHEHFPITAVEGHALISKAGSDAKWVARIDLDRRASGPVERFYELIPITSALPDDPRTASVVASFESRLGTELDAVVGSTRTPLDASSRRLRASETSAGNLLADAAREDAHADVAIMNSGGIRGDRVYPAGPLSRRSLLELHPFGNVICTLSVPGSVVLEALESGVSKLPAAAGQFPQISGMTMEVSRTAPPGHRVSNVLVNGERLDPAKTYRLAIPDFILKGGDAYAMFAGQKVLVGPESGDLLATALEHYVADHHEVAPSVEGRIVFR